MTTNQIPPDALKRICKAVQAARWFSGVDYRVCRDHIQIAAHFQNAIRGLTPEDWAVVSNNIDGGDFG